MPKTKLQDFVYTIIMVIVMVYVMIAYNVAIGMGEMNNSVFLISLGELPIMGVIAFLLELTVRNFPMALCWQIFYAGPFVRFIFRKIFAKQLAK